MDASEIYSKRLNAKEVIFPEEKGEFIFPIADGRSNLLGGDRDLSTSTSIRQCPIQGESHLDFLGESEGSLPPPRDSFPDAGEAINDFWSMSGNFIFRHHVGPRDKLYSPREEPFPIPLKYIDVSRTTHTNLDVKQEKRIDVYWNIDGSRDLSDPWTGFIQCTLLEEKPPNGYMWSGWRLTRKQLTSRPDHLWPELWEKVGKNAKLRDKQKCHMKSSILITQENCEGPISSTRRTRNLRRPSRKLARNWKHQWLLLCPAKLLRAVRIVGVVDPIKSKQNLRVFSKLVNLQDFVWENHCRIIMKTILQEKETTHDSIAIWFKFFLMPQAMRIPAAKAAVDKEWENLEKISAWNLTKVRSKKEVIDEAWTKGVKVHFASLMDICHLKNAELEAKHQKYKGRVVLRGDIVKDDSGVFCSVH